MGINPSFKITNTVVLSVAEIAEMVGRLSVGDTAANPVMRRTGRIKSVYGSLAIEQNSLSLSQVTAVINGKRVLAPPKDIAEVKNAYEIYERLSELDPYSVDDLLLAHSVMTRGLVDESGAFRSRPVGVVDSDGNILHVGTLARYVPEAVSALLEWVKTSDVHMLIKSCVFHYEFEVIHPFADGNGRMGRLWHTLLLSNWNKAFAWLPVESIIHDNQSEYYRCINVSNDAGDCTAFVEFMLSAIKASLIEAISVSDGVSDAKEAAEKARCDMILDYLDSHGTISNSDVRELLCVSSSTANRILSRLTADQRLVKCFVNGHWAYKRSE